MSKKFAEAKARILAAPRLVESQPGTYAPADPAVRPSALTTSSKLAALREGRIMPPGVTATPHPDGQPVWLPPPLTEEQVFAFCDRMAIKERPVHTGYNIWVVTTVVTPVQAHDWLCNFEVDNRDPNRDHTMELVLDLVEGNWMLTHQGIGVSPEGNIQDGHHRLEAIYESRVPAPLMIVFNITDRARMAFDTNMKRRPQDVIHAISMATGKVFEVENRDFPVLRSALQGLSQKRPQRSTMQLVALSEKHRKALDFVHGHFSSTRQGATAPVLGAILRAWYSVPHGLLSDYCTILKHGSLSGNLAPHQIYACLMRDWMMGAEKTVGAAETITVHAVSRQVAKHWHFFGRATRSIRGFVAGETTTRLTSDSDEKFPLP
jgi:hypothetical protein